MNKFDFLIPTILILLAAFMFSVIGYKQAQNDMIKGLGTPTTTYYFVDPEVVDIKVNAVSDLFIKGELKIGTCYEQ